MIKLFIHNLISFRNFIAQGIHKGNKAMFSMANFMMISNIHEDTHKDLKFLQVDIKNAVEAVSKLQFLTTKNQ